DLEQVADNAVVRDFEDGRVGVFVDGNNRVRPFHADEMLNGARDTQREIQLWRYGLARAAYLPLHWQPPRIADRTRRCQFRAEGIRQSLRKWNVRLLLNAAPHGHDSLGLREVDGLPRLLERRFRFLSNGSRLNGNGQRPNRSRSAPSCRL